MTIPNARPRAYPLFALYGAVALGWVMFAGWLVPPLLTAEHPGSGIGALKRYIESFASPFIARDTGDRWHQFTAASLIALGLHLSIVLLIWWHDRGAALGRSSADFRAERRASLLLIMLSLVFLAVTIISGPVHDYLYYLFEWYKVRQGDPWFIVIGPYGRLPLNAYGPLFNLLAVLELVNPLAPKLLFAYAYILFCLWQFKEFAASHRLTGARTAALTALFWNPFPWVEIAIRGHFDILVAVFCVGALRARTRGSDFRSGISLALGVLLKFFPVVLLPFLAFKRGHLRRRLLIATVATIALGMGVSYYLWGMSTLTPMTFAVNRRSNCLSVFFFLRKRYSPLLWLTPDPDIDQWASIILFAALVCVWFWYRLRDPEIEAACVVAVTTTALLYQTGFPQNHMVPFALGAAWAARYWDVAKGRIARVIAVTAYFGWLAAFNAYSCAVNESSYNYVIYVEPIVGLPTFVIGCGFVATVAWSAWPTNTR